jgi:serine/threonine-protein kinase PRP4
VEQPLALTDGGPIVPTAARKSGSSHAQRNDNPDNWDDAEGHYTYGSRELLNGRYEMAAAHGKGVFSTVVRAKDIQAGKDDPEQVAIKIVRSDDTILEKLAAGADNKHHCCVRFLSSFRYQNHLCLVFESLDTSLRSS